MRRLPSLVALLVGAFISAPAAADPVPVTAFPVERFAVGSSETRFGELEFLGGVELVSPDRRFAGFSGIALRPDGIDALLISDEGYLARARLVYEDGRLIGLADVTISKIFPGETPDKLFADAEDLAVDPDDPGSVIVVFERRDEPVIRFRLAPEGLRDPEILPVPEGVKRLRWNKELESVAFMPPGSPWAGHILVIAERAAERGAAHIPAWILGAGEFSIVRRDGYDITSARFLPDGDLVILERRFRPGLGAGMRLRHIPGGRVSTNVVVDGEVLIQSSLGHQIDNMEGLAVHRDAEGRTVLTLVSDDNASLFQRTLILQFAIAPRPAATQARRR